MPPLAAAVGIVSGVVGIASTVSGLSAQAANKKEIKQRNEAAAIANEQLEGVNQDLRTTIRSVNQKLASSTRDQNKVIRQANREIDEQNQKVVRNINRANDLIVDANRAKIEQTKLQQGSELLTAARERRQAIRERQIAEGQVVNTGAALGVRGSAVSAATSSLSSQLGEALGFQSQQTNISRDITRQSLIESRKNLQASRSTNRANLAHIESVQIQRRAEADLQVRQNRQNLAITRAQNRVALLNNTADRIKEQASLNPQKFIADNKTPEMIARERREAEASNNRQREVQRSNGDRDSLGRRTDAGI